MFLEDGKGAHQGIAMTGIIILLRGRKFVPDVLTNKYYKT